MARRSPEGVCRRSPRVGGTRGFTAIQPAARPATGATPSPRPPSVIGGRHRCTGSDGAHRVDEPHPVHRVSTDTGCRPLVSPIGWSEPMDHTRWTKATLHRVGPIAGRSATGWSPPCARDRAVGSGLRKWPGGEWRVRHASRGGDGSVRSRRPTLDRDSTAACRGPVFLLDQGAGQGEIGRRESWSRGASETSGPPWPVADR